MILRAQIFISAIFAQLSSTQSMRETRYRAKAGPEVVFKRGSLIFYSTFVAQLG